MAVQFGAVPANTMFATGNNVKFDDDAVTEVKQLKVLSTSVTVNGTVIVPLSATV